MTAASLPQRPTLVTLARQIGVSRQTVSNVINAPHLVKPSTRERVLKAVIESGYRPSVAARTLRTNRSMMLGLRLFPINNGITRAVMDRFLHQLATIAHAHGYRLTLFTAADDNEELDQLLELAQRGAIDGCVLTDTSATDRRPEVLSAEGIQFVSFGRPWGQPGATHPWVDVDGGAGTAKATAYLRSLGHERIGFLGWPAGSGVGDDRHSGWLRTLSPPGRTDADVLTVRVEDGTHSGAQGMHRLLEAGATAIVCTSDTLALGAASAALKVGIALPVIGFDDTPTAAALGMSSVAQPLEEAAVAILEALVAILTDRAVEPRTTLLEPDLVLRAEGPFRIPQPPERN